MYKKILSILCFFAFLSNVVTAQSNDDDDDINPTMESVMWNSCTSCLQSGNPFGSQYLGSFEVGQYQCLNQGETYQCNQNGCVSVSGSNENKMCTEVYCAQFPNEGACNAATNVQGTKYACSWSSNSGHCNASIWSMIKSFMIPIIIILCLCIVGCIVACIFMATKKKKSAPRQQETVIIQGGQTTPYAQMNDATSVNSQI